MQAAAKHKAALSTSGALQGPPHHGWYQLSAPAESPPHSGAAPADQGTHAFARAEWAPSDPASSNIPMCVLWQHHGAWAVPPDAPMSREVATWSHHLRNHK
jgi:hypothetical protein